MNTTQYIIRVGGRVYTTTLSKVHALDTARRLRDVEHMTNVRLYSKQVRTVEVTATHKPNSLSSILYGAGYGITPSAKAKARGTAYVPFNDPLRGSCFADLLVVLILAAVGPCLVQDNTTGNAGGAVDNIIQSIEQTNDALEDSPAGQWLAELDAQNN